MGERTITRPDEMEWVTIPTGEFIMGSDAGQEHHIREIDSEFPDEWLAREQPQREVSFRIHHCEIYGDQPAIQGICR